MATTRTESCQVTVYIVATDIDDARSILARHLTPSEPSEYGEPVYDTEREAEGHVPEYSNPLGYTVYTVEISITGKSTQPAR